MRDENAMRTLRKLMVAIWALAGFSSALHAQPTPEATSPRVDANDDLKHQDWHHHGSLYILTTPDGADLADNALIEDFPLLVRLHKDWFDFSLAAPDGSDVRFASATGDFLPYQIDHWDSEKGEASIWVRVPKIHGNAQQELKLLWGNGKAKSVSDGKSVFNETNGYASVWHMSDSNPDELATLHCTEVGMRSIQGMIGKAKHLGGGEGVFGGENIEVYPSGASPHSTEAWFRAERPNSTIIGWGNEGGGRGSKVRMQFRSPPHLHIDSDFSDVKGTSTLALNEWIHVAHTYDGQNGKIYINGQLDGSASPTLNIKRPSRLWIGGWYHQYDFVGDIDEVRISRVARSADWIKLQYLNQNLYQSVVGPLATPGNELALAPTSTSVAENEAVTLVAKAGGARKLIWTVKRAGDETVLAVDRLAYSFNAGRVAGDESCVITLKAIYENETKTVDVPILVKEAMPEPRLVLKGTTNWDGRSPIEVSASITNLEAIRKANAGEVELQWSTSGMAVIKQVQDGKLLLQRSLNSGELIVQCQASNGGVPATASHTIKVQEPKSDPWLPRSPLGDEKPVDHQFFARDDRGRGTLYCNGTLNEDADTVFVKIYANDTVFHEEHQTPRDDREYAFKVKLNPGLIVYSFELGSTVKGVTQILHRASNLVCGDAYLISGQSNALATDWGQEKHEFSSRWIRSFGNSRGEDGIGWGDAVPRGDRRPEIGCWGMELAKNLVERHQIPVCIINGAVGGTLIEAHQRNDSQPNDRNTIYGRLLDRVEKAKLTDGIRGVFWYQGENNQGAQGATGKYGWETYESLFLEMASDWKRDYPNIQHFYIFQIWPNSCSMGGTDASDRLRDIQRRLPRHFSHMTAISTLGIKPEGPCHFPPAGYIALAEQVLPLVEKIHYGKVFLEPVNAADIKNASFTSSLRNEVTLEFDQPMNWSDSLLDQFFLDGQPVRILSGEASANTITLKLEAPSQAKSVSYLKDKTWSSERLLSGKNRIAALTFFEVAIADPE